MPLQLPTRLHPDAPHLDHLTPRSAIPGGSFEVTGSLILKGNELPEAFFGETPATFDMARPTRARIRVPSGAISSDLIVRRNGVASNVLHANVGVPMAEDLHLVANPAVDADGNIFAMVSGPRGETVPVSIYRIARDLQISAHVRDVLNVSALAFDPTGQSGSDLFASSRADGAIYRITPEGNITTFAEGMGIATGLAFDRNGNLFVGDRSGTIFKLRPGRTPGENAETFVFATLEPSVAFYHLCFHPDGRLFVTAPSTSSHQPIYAVDADGNTTTFFNGLGRPQGMAFDVDGNLYIAASLHGERGIIRVWPSSTGTMQAELTVAGNDLVGLCFLDDGCAALATHTTLFHADLGIEGLPLI